MGCRGKYRPEETPQLAEQYARDGLIDEEICAKLGISHTTFYRWQKKHVEFYEALKRGKEVVDAEVEKALLTRALGYEYEEIKTMEGPRGTKTEVTRKHVVPDTTAQIFWLKNRRPDKWRDKREFEHSGPDGGPIQVEDMSDQELLKEAAKYGLAGADD